jgi:hypothetical protein
MARQKSSPEISPRLNTINTVIAEPELNKVVSAAYQTAKGDWQLTLAALRKAKVKEPEFRKINFAHSLAELTGDNIKLSGKIATLPGVNTVRDFAFTHDKTAISNLLRKEDIPQEVIGASLEERKQNYAATIHNKLFATETSAVLHRMVAKSELPIADSGVREGLNSFFVNQPGFNIRTSSVYNAINKPDAFKGVSDDTRDKVITQLKTLQRVQAISLTPEAVNHLMEVKIQTAFQVSEMSPKDFAMVLSKKMSEEEAMLIHTNATNARIQYDQVLVSMHEFLNEPHIAAINRSPDKPEKMRMLQKKSDDLQVPVNWENLFGNVDFCECGECTSVYSPASYFVELLQYLRNNNLGPQTGPQAIKTDPKDISGTVLEKLFRRRPDLGCLELTCENTNTVLPYIDLVNEVMESFVVHLSEFHADTNDPKQTAIDPWNVEDETSSELLAQPQHINYDAYCILKKAVFPFTLPYHQPVHATRIFLRYLETSRYELMKTFRPAGLPANKNEELPEDTTMPPAAPNPDGVELAKLNNDAIDRAIDAEFLEITQEEFIILTKQAFWDRKYFEIKCRKNFTEEEYRSKIGVKKTHAYYGYATEADMLNTDETDKLGLAFVKDQFLKRTGLLYVDLVELLKTKVINPAYPRGRALTILESIRFSYRFLQSLVNSTSSDPKVRFGKLVSFLEKSQPFLPLVDALLHPDPCNPESNEWCVESKDLKKWVCCYFEKIGKLIVLESGEGPSLPIWGDLYTSEQQPEYIGTLHADGTIKDKSGKLIGTVNITGKATDATGKSFLEKYGKGASSITILNQDGKPVGFLDSLGLRTLREKRVTWLPAKDTCDLNKVRLKHLDGTDISVAEYDTMQRFIRLWRKLGWTLDETDRAITGLAVYKLDDPVELPTDEDCTNCFDEYENDCDCLETEDEWGCGPAKESLIFYDITPDFLHQLVFVKKLLDSTGLELIKLLTFWTGISTNGEKSLYKRLFLTHNLIGIDKIFQPDKNGNYLSKTEKITDHIPVLMAAFNFKSEDIATIMEFKQMKDELTLPNITVLYRYGLLMRVLHVKSDELKEIQALFRDIFKNAGSTYAFMECWGKMEDAGFAFRQLNYFIRGVDDDKKPLSPKKKMILQLAKNLYDGLNKIDKDHPDLDRIDAETISQLQKVPPLTAEEKTALLQDKATEELIRSKVSLLFDQNTVASIIGILQGTTSYSTNAPKNLVAKAEDFTSKLNDTLKKKISYDFVKGAIQVTGILTKKEITDSKALFNPPDWAKAIDRVGKQALYYFNDVLAGLFAGSLAESKQVLLQGDINIPEEQQDQLNPLINTASVKRKYFIEKFLPFLRNQLTHRFLVDALSAASGIEKKSTDVLLSTVLTGENPPRPILEIIMDVKNLPPAGNTGWKGYLIPASDDEYTFAVVSDTDPASIKIDGGSLTFTQQEDPSNLWLSDPVKLQSGRPYLFEASGLSSDLNELSWKTPTSPKAAIPTSMLLPDYSAKSVEGSFVKLQKAGMLINGFTLDDEEISYLQNNGNDFDLLDFNQVSLNAWKRIEAYARFRNSLAETGTKTIALFAWAKQTNDSTLLVDKIAGLTKWKKEDVGKLIAPEHFNLNLPENFTNEKNLLKIQQALYVADKISMDINLLFDWARPGSKFFVCHDIAESIRKSIRARYKQEDWEQVVKPLNDQLRENQKNALISYLLVQPDLINWGVVDADSLFEFFLIDVKMDACMETSRMKQAISSVQLFVQRCFLGLESNNGVAGNVLDRTRWEWMQRNVIWQANRKVFLYPENWIEGDLRDDKSPFYKELESELLQKDINKQNVQDALKVYLFKIDEVANLEVVGLFIETATDKDGNTLDNPVKMHVFSRSRNAPYFFFYRYFDVIESNWYPWEKVQVDIPNYDVENADSHLVSDNGCYLTPVVWNGRLLIFFPQIMKKTKPNAATNAKTYNKIGSDESPNTSKPSEYWEIKLAWSEYRNKKWTQKQVSKDAIASNNLDATHDIPYFKFVPFVFKEYVLVSVDDFLDSDAGFLNTFRFEGSKILLNNATQNTNEGIPINYFNKSNKVTVYSWQIKNGLRVNKTLSFSDMFSKTVINNFYNPVTVDFYHPFTQVLLGLLNLGELDEFFSYNKIVPDTDSAFGSYDDNNPGTSVSFHELKRPYSLYNWELFFHTPVLLADKLSKSRQFEEAMKWYHYVFNPLAFGLESNRAWQFYPFQHIDADNFLDTFFNGLQPNIGNDQINEWRNKPFAPHVIARSRPSAYMKWVVMKYLDNLIAWGDYLFRQDTIETINQATQLYILAGHILGPRPQMIPKRGKIKPQTYKSLLDKWDAFGNAMVELELVFPFSNQTSFPVGVSNGVIGLANIFGFASSLYFCIPNNPKLMSYWDTIADRLFKIRHCENIEGVFRKLALWDAPIDPGLLVQATAQGLSLDSVLNDLNSPLPNYRFNYLIQKALELCSELKTMGSSLLSVFEKKDAEILANMRARHDSSVQNLIMEIRKLQVEEANKSLDGLDQNRKTVVYRLQHQLKLIGEDLNKVPSGDADFAEINNPIEQPVDESGLKLIAYEKEDMDKASEAAGWQIGIGITETIAAVLNIIPSIGGYVTPIGVGANATWGGSNLGSAASAVARGMQTYSNHLSFQSSSAGKKGGFLRQLQERVFQANLAGYEIKQIDKQILSQKIRIDIANQEITNQQQLIDNASEIEEFLKNKYTNEELFSWMEGSIKALYHQVYTLAYDIAKKAEKVFRFERGITSSDFIQFGYWDASRDGLHAGERLYLGIKQLESAWQEKRGYDYEISKPVSLRQVNPLALIELKEKGKCEFELPEVLFDMDYPGHYMRRIKTVAISIPCIAGPYTTINATLRLLENKYRISSIAKDSRDYIEKTEETDERFAKVNIPITSIAASSGQNDSGVFELSFKDERYMPFEGAGTISKWRLELPDDFRLFDYETITDVILQMRYTSLDGGDKLKNVAAGSLKNYIKSVEELSQREGLFVIFDLKHDFPNEWYKATQIPPAGNDRILALTNLPDRLPVFTKSRQPDKIRVSDAIVMTSANMQASDVKLTQNGDDNDFSNGVNIGLLKAFAIHDLDLPFDKWELKITDNTIVLDKMILVVRYILKN